MPIFSLKITAEKSADFDGFFYVKPQPNAPLNQSENTQGNPFKFIEKMLFFCIVSQMKRFAILCGEAPEDFKQQKLVQMHDFLLSGDGGHWDDKDIIEFPAGINAQFLRTVLENSAAMDADEILLYFCTKLPVSDSEPTFWIGGQEISRQIILDCQKKFPATGFQVIFDVGSALVSYDALGYEKV